jgi:uncharacterized protein YciI
VSEVPSLDRVELVLLRRPASRPEVTDDEAARLQRLHLRHLTAMLEAGHLLVAGPVDEQPDESLRGLCLYRTGSLTRTRELAESDPAVAAGRLAVDVMWLYCPEGQLPVGPRR